MTGARRLPPSTDPGSAGDHEVPAAIPAATVVLMRDAPDGLEVLLLRRDSRLAFAGGMWVFPGGRIDEHDFPPGGARDDPETLFEAARAAVVREAKEEADLDVDPESLVWFAHWTPPPGEARRFATWFFLAVAPTGTVVVDDGEIRDHQWIKPADAVAQRDANAIELITPTWVTLHWLAAATNVDDALKLARDHEATFYVTHMHAIDGGRVAIWEGDEAYEHGDLARPGPRHRLTMLQNGSWHLERDE